MRKLTKWLFAVGVVALATALTVIFVKEVRRNNQLPVSTEAFVSAARGLGYDIRKTTYGSGADVDGVIEVVTADKGPGQGAYYVNFYVLEDTDAAKRLFREWHENFKKEMKYSFSYGTENRSGMLGNSQDFYLGERDSRRRVIRVDRTVAFSVTEEPGQDEEVKELFDGIGYKFTADR